MLRGMLISYSELYSGASLASDSCSYCLSGVTREVIHMKSNVFDFSLLRDEIQKKVYIAGSFFLSLMVLEPRWVFTKIEKSDWIDVRTKKGF